MTNKKQFVKNIVMLSAVNIVMRGVAVSFNAYLKGKIGDESMGLFTLVMSIYGFAVTLALSYVNLSAVKLTAERCAQLKGADKSSYRRSMRSVLWSVTRYSLIFGLSTGLLLYFSSPLAAEFLLKDMRTVSSLKVIAFSLPAISLSSAISGYFTGIRKPSRNAVAAVTEQLMKIIITSTALVMIMPGDVEHSCLAVVGGAALGEAWSLIINLVMYITDNKKAPDTVLGDERILIKTSFADTVKISLPSAVGAYTRQGLTTLEHLAIPNGLRKSGLSQSAALSTYGLLQGIAFPLVMFPYAVIGSFTSLLIPEISEKNASGNRMGINKIISDVYKYSAVFSMGACGIFINFSRELGEMVYNSSEAALYTFLLGLLVPFMYLDTTVDAILKGLGEQVYSMKVNIIDSASGLILVMLLTPSLGIYGYILTVWICEIGNLALSIGRLAKVTGVRISTAVGKYFKPLVSLAISSAVCTAASLIFKVSTATEMVLFIVIYLAIVFLEIKEKRPAIASLL